ncbi:MAG: hypothetical protein KDJ37_17745 [Hyphomicrobiaceae bacterium]|nr:hypothetical protein [Hyphomicrobiaceae bacterium]
MITMLMPSHAVAGALKDRPAIVSNVAILGDDVMLVHAKRPAHCAPAGALIIFPGFKRNAYDYLERASELAKSQCLSIYAPEFDRRKFPRWRYQRGGVLKGGRIADPKSCTGHVIERLIGWVRSQEGRPDLPIILFGHSAGGQLLSRVTAYCPLEGPHRPSRIVVANPSGHVGAMLGEAVPYGFAVPGQENELMPHAEQRLKAYLAQPITIYLGGRDTGTRRLNQEEGARRQGSNRFERGVNVYEVARRLAERNGWPFGWRLVVAPAVGHSSEDMLTAPEAADALMSPH